MKTSIATLLLFASNAVLHAQTASSPATQRDYGNDSAYENVFVAPAVSTGGATTKPTLMAGVTIGQYFTRPGGIAASPQFELGIVGPLPGGNPLDGLVSVDYMFAGKVPHRTLFPSLTAGYTRMFATGNAVNLGFGVDFGHEPYKRLIRIELRDYYLFTGLQQHVIGLRIAFGKMIAD